MTRAERHPTTLWALSVDQITDRTQDLIGQLQALFAELERRNEQELVTGQSPGQRRAALHVVRDGAT